MSLSGSARPRSLTSFLSTSGSDGFTTGQLFKTGLVLASAIIIAGLAFWTWTDFAGARRDAEERVSAAALVVEEHAQRSLVAIDVVLESIAELAEERGLDWLRSAAGWQRLRRIASRLPETGAVFVADRAGRIIAATPSNPPPVANVSDREWFRLLKDGEETLHIGRALKGRTVHNLFFPVARAIRGPDGAFNGAVQVGVEVTYIEQLLRSLDVGPAADLGLYRVSDGAVVAKYPMTEALLDQSVSATPFFSALAQSQGSSWIGWVRIEDQDRLVSARRVSGLPLLVTASSSEGQVYAGAWGRLWWRVSAAALALAALCGLTGLALEQARREALFHDALAERNAQLALAGKAALVGSWSLDVETGRMQVSEGFVATHGFPEGTAEITRGELLARVHPDDVARFDARRSESFAEQQDEHVSDYRIVRAGGEVRWIESRSYIAYDDAGQARRMVGVNFDVTERKRAEARQSQLIAELDHRVKNVLARVAAVIFSMREASGSMADFATALEGRIRSMADTHELLSSSRWKGVPLAECVRRELAPYATADNTQVEGPEVILTAEATQAVATVLHELVTNAAKYGALSSPHGRVAVRWASGDDGNSRERLVLSWQETGGPAVVAPRHLGYGTSVIRDLIPYEFGGAVELTLAADGVRCRIDIPLN